MINLIVAMAKNNVIGRSNDLPWYLPADLKHFKQLTTGNTIVMGRKTYESIAARIGGPLPNRRNIIVTRDPEYNVVPGAEVLHSLEDALRDEHEELFVIGGAEIYKQTLEIANTLYVTEVAADIEGDAFFPIIDRTKWLEVFREAHEKDDRNEYDYAFVTYERIRPR